MTEERTSPSCQPHPTHPPLPLHHPRPRSRFISLFSGPHPLSHLSPGPVLTTAADPDPDHDPEAPVPDTLTTTETLDPHLPLPETQIQLHLQPPQKRMKPQQQQLGGTKGVAAPGTETKHQKSRTRGGPVDPRLGQGQSLKLRSIFRFGTGPPYRPRKRPPPTR